MKTKAILFIAMLGIGLGCCFPCSAVTDSCLYRKPFCEVRVQEGIRYGKAQGYWSSMEGVDQKAARALCRGVMKTFKKGPLELSLDLYSPEGLSGNKPLIMFIHGGGFYCGSRKENAYVDFCRYFASMGYITASIDYRMGFRLNRNSLEMAGYDALDDARTALDFLVANAGTFGIDTGRIFVAGSSSGAIMSLNLAFRGGEDNPCPRILAVGNLWGALLDTDILEGSSTAIVSFHGDSDYIVPYAEGYTFTKPERADSPGTFAMKMYGSGCIDLKADSLGLKHKLYTFAGQGHALNRDKGKYLNDNQTFIKEKMAEFFHDCMPVPPAELSFVAAAHRACHFAGLVPENSPEGVAMAARFGYHFIECDPRWTKDSVLVLMHDDTINRTMRNALDNSEIGEPVHVENTTFHELRTKYVLASSDPRFRTRIPTLREQLDSCRKYGITPILHSGIPQAYEMAQEIMGDGWVCFNNRYDRVRAVREFSDCLVLWDPREYEGDDLVGMLEKIGGHCGISSMKYQVFDADAVAQVRNAGYEFQSSIWKTPFDARAAHDGASIILSDWFWTPTEGLEPSDVKYGRNLTLGEGESIAMDFSHDRFSAMTLYIEFEGTLKITLNGNRTYDFTHGEMEREYIGLRMNDTSARILIESGGETLIKAYRAEYYTI